LKRPFNQTTNIRLTKAGFVVKINYLHRGCNFRSIRNGAETANGADAIEAQVTDTGIGIHRKDRQRNFRPFEQMNNSTGRRYQGTGLGLSLTREPFELLGGSIWAESEGEDSTFSFIIPITAASSC
jgi:signal transduction histidine kinase